MFFFYVQKHSNIGCEPKLYDLMKSNVQDSPGQPKRTMLPRKRM